MEGMEADDDADLVPADADDATGFAIAGDVGEAGEGTLKVGVWAPWSFETAAGAPEPPSIDELANTAQNEGDEEIAFDMITQDAGADGFEGCEESGGN